ncbi:hypothetical protein [Sphingomonas sp.]|uniref:lipopolysaccharide biosynthesis protein n=1 Tax=Sphingomonas sp. TaxID=28214 RepID=UPI001B18DB23|nr:hypothetical protein [Sphingomonas sp.]MBO9711484.1 hypothetical protein [Sphingomonas sp.]
MPIRPSHAARMLRSRLARQIAEQTIANLAVQGLGAITTFSFVHLLPPHQYAIFGLCIATVGFVSVSSDLGLMASTSYFWRHQVTGGAPFAEHYAAIKRVRLVLFAFTGSIGGGVLAWLVHRESGDWTAALSIAPLALALAWTQILMAMSVAALRLSGDLRRAYLADLSGAVTRASLALAAFALALQHAWFPLISLGIAALVTLSIVQPRLDPAFRSRGHATRDAVRQVVRYIIPTTPSTIFFATQDILVYWLATLSGGAIVIAQTFALGRLGAIFVTLSAIMANVIIPRIVNIADDRHALRTALVTVAAIGGFCSALLFVAWMVPGLFLILLGNHYAGLAEPLLLCLGAASLQVVAHGLGNMNRAMGWVRWETPMICVQAVLVAAIVPFFHFSTTKGVLGFNLVLNALWLANIAAVTLLGVRQMRRRGQSPEMHPEDQPETPLVS